MLTIFSPDVAPRKSSWHTTFSLKIYWAKLSITSDRGWQTASGSSKLQGKTWDVPFHQLQCLHHDATFVPPIKVTIYGSVIASVQGIKTAETFLTAYNVTKYDFGIAENVALWL